jgi:alpha-mannosidase
MCSHGAHGAPQEGSEAIPTTAKSYPLRAPAPVGKKITSLYKKRLTNFFTPGQWEKVNLMA